MKKSDLHTGMLVTLRNNESYYVMLNTGLGGKQENVLVHKIDKDIGWLTLDHYIDDLTYYDNDPDPVIPGSAGPDPD